jgi:hypothetical protein
MCLVIWEHNFGVDWSLPVYIRGIAFMLSVLALSLHRLAVSLTVVGNINSQERF